VIGGVVGKFGWISLSSSRPIAADHDRQLNGYQIHCPSQAVRGGLQRALSRQPRLAAAVIELGALKSER